MKYKISHDTTYEYADAVPVCQNLVHLVPRATDYQSCSYHRLTVRPNPATSSRRGDYFGNTATIFSVTQSHRRLQIRASSKVELRPRPVPEPTAAPSWQAVQAQLRGDRTPQGLAAYQFCFRSPHVPLHHELAEYAGASFTADRPLLAAVADLTSRIHTDFTYDPTATTVSTPIMEVFRQRRGVCQDLAHLQIGCLRAVGLAARYVSGYVRTYPAEDKPQLVGADASHAWLSVYCGPAGWIDVDPTNDLFPSAEHITLAWGRDFGDVCPVSGMFVGGGNHQIRVAVEVQAVS